MSDISNMTVAMREDGFVGEWYSVIHMGRAYRVQVKETGEYVYDDMMHIVTGDKAENIINEAKEFRDEEAK